MFGLFQGGFNFLASLGNLFTAPPPHQQTLPTTPHCLTDSPSSLPSSSSPPLRSEIESPRNELIEDFYKILCNTYQSREDILNKYCKVIVIETLSWLDLQNFIQDAREQFVQDFPKPVSPDTVTRDTVTMDLLSKIDETLTNLKNFIFLAESLYTSSSHPDHTNEEFKKLKSLSQAIQVNINSWKVSMPSYPLKSTRDILASITTFWDQNKLHLLRFKAWADLSPIRPKVIEVRHRSLPLSHEKRENPEFWFAVSKNTKERYVGKLKYLSAFVIASNAACKQGEDGLTIIESPKKSSSYRYLFSLCIKSSSHKSKSPRHKSSTSKLLFGNVTNVQSTTSNKYSTGAISSSSSLNNGSEALSKHPRKKKGSHLTLSQSQRINYTPRQTDSFYRSSTPKIKSGTDEWDLTPLVNLAIQRFNSEIFSSLPDKSVSSSLLQDHSSRLSTLSHSSDEASTSSMEL